MTRDTDRDAREVVRAAEQLVGDAWIGRLLLAETEAEAILGACTQARDRAGDRVRTAQEHGDLAELALWQTHLELADIACGRAQEAHEEARSTLTSELAVWSEETARRVRQALSEEGEGRGRGQGRW